MDSHDIARSDDQLPDSSAPTVRTPVAPETPARPWADTLPDLGAVPSPRAYSVAPPRPRSRFSIAPPTLRVAFDAR